MHVLGIAVLFAALVYVVPRFEAMFMDQGGPLPAATQGLLSLSALARTYWLAIVPVLAVLIVLDFKLFARMFEARRDLVAWSLHVCIMIAGGLVFVWIVVALLLPLRNL